jgi:hypothetical protein
MHLHFQHALANDAHYSCFFVFHRPIDFHLFTLALYILMFYLIIKICPHEFSFLLMFHQIWYPPRS